jgi:hypothetical protein
MSDGMWWETAFMEHLKKPTSEPPVRSSELVSLLADGIKAAEGAQVIMEAYYEDDYRDPCNSDQYCRLMDWLKAARRHQEKQANDPSSATAGPKPPDCQGQKASKETPSLSS